MQLRHFKEESLPAWHELTWAVKAGGNAFEKAHGQPFFAYIKDRPAMELQFSQGMATLDHTGAHAKCSQLS